jgi:hypothetical protein
MTASRSSTARSTQAKADQAAKEKEKAKQDFLAKYGPAKAATPRAPEPTTAAEKAARDHLLVLVRPPQPEEEHEESGSGRGSIEASIESNLPPWGSG